MIYVIPLTQYEDPHRLCEFPKVMVISSDDLSKYIEPAGKKGRLLCIHIIEYILDTMLISSKLAGIGVPDLNE